MKTEREAGEKKTGEGIAEAEGKGGRDKQRRTQSYFREKKKLFFPWMGVKGNGG
jgi:hypothetical protein